MREIISGLFSEWTRGDLLGLAQVLIAALVVLLTSVAAVWGWTVRAWLTERRLIGQFGSDLYLPEDIRDATRYYVRPDATNIDLAQEIEEGHHIVVVREDLFKNVDRFLIEESKHHHMILLADSGMGKSSFVLNYYEYNRRKWRRRHKLAVIPLGIGTALEKIKEIPRKNETILLLDAFDEDPGARNDYKQRLDELMETCIEFRRVLITCRTQFFPTDADIPTVAGPVFAPRKGQAQHAYWRLYIAPFSDRQVDKYLRRRFKFWERREKRVARELAQKAPKLTVRPMLLLHIPDLLQAGEPVTSAWDIYRILTEKWYEREIGFWKDKEVLRKISEEVAVQFYINFRKHGSDRVPREAIVKILKQIRTSKELAGESLNDIDEWKATSRSLLHRDAEGNWKFAHRSVMEFLFLKSFIQGDERCRGVLWTDQMKKFADEIFHHRTALSHRHTIPRADLRGVNFSGADLGGVDLSEADIGGVYLQKANLNGADLSRANLSNADLSLTNLRHANLNSANLSGTELAGADLTGADLTGANLAGADLSGADLTDITCLSAQPLSKALVDFASTTLPPGLERELESIKFEELQKNGLLPSSLRDHDDYVPGHPGPRPTDLVPIIRRVLEANAYPAAPLCRTEARLPESLVVSLSDGQQYETVIKTLVVNALEAMGAEGGALTVEAGKVDENLVYLSVSDTGPGMDEKFMRLRLFRPFVTTKKNHLGLGLFTCREVVETYGGRIEVESKPGAGTHFRVLLPPHPFAGRELRQPPSAV